MPSMNIISELDLIIEQINQLKNKISTPDKIVSTPAIPQWIHPNEKQMIEALLRGFITDKDLEIHFANANFSVKHLISKMYKDYKVLNRGQLIRALIDKFC